jgi:hypothetical protein
VHDINRSNDSVVYSPRNNTVPGTSNVKLELYLDRTNGLNGGDWKLQHSYTDIPNGWLSSKAVPSECPAKNEDTILRPGNVCFLRIDGDIETQARWSRASIRHITSKKKTTIQTCTSDSSYAPVQAPVSSPTAPLPSPISPAEWCFFGI